MYSVAERMTAKYGWQVKAETRRSGLLRIQGLVTRGLTFEPVRQRRVFSRDWEEVRPVAVAANRVGGLLRGGKDPCPDCGHAVVYHPGRIPVGACALCISDEDHHKIAPAEMCQREFPPTIQAS